MYSYAVVDVETTGFGKSDRIVEIAIVLVSNGQITREWETLVNPDRDISNSNIHGITSELVSMAPTFEEIASEVGYLLNGRILVAHNIAFDSRMLRQEFVRIDGDIEFGQGVCTLQATKMKLSAACDEYGVRNSLAHRALGDARATAQVFLQLSGSSNAVVPIYSSVENLIAPARILTRDAILSETKSDATVMLRPVPDFNETGFSGAQLSYLDILSFVMADLSISDEESLLLRQWAEALGMSVEEQNEVHQDYLYLILAAANRDKFISETEVVLIKKAANALGVREPSLPSLKVDDEAVLFSNGTRVCFTGEARAKDGSIIMREFLQELAIKRGLVPVDLVTKKSCELLVAVDKSSQSGKTKKARKFGILVISLSEFLIWAE